MSSILIVDDNPQNLQVLGNHLSNAEYDLSFAMSGKEALTFLENANNHPDCILLDIMMPEMSGFEVCQEIRKDKRLNWIPVIFLTAKNDTDDIVHGFDVGGTDYVTKPFNSRELLARIKTQIALKQAREEINQLRGIIPLCSNCGKIRDDEGYYQQLHEFVSKMTGVSFSHGICPNCAKEMYGDLLAGDDLKTEE